MNADIDTVSLDVTLTGTPTRLSYNGHLIDYGRQGNVSCKFCGAEPSFEMPSDERYRWEAILYMCSQLPECDKAADDLKEAIDQKLMEYTGRVADPGTMNALEKDILDIVGHDANVNLSKP